jgi:prepilin-type N-terminal cleavage/methylation domain-containing protein
VEAFRGRTQAPAGTCRAVAWGVERTVSGYTLLEVLVGIALVSLVGLAVFGGYVFAGARLVRTPRPSGHTGRPAGRPPPGWRGKWRLAGACLPRQSPLASLRPLAGADLGEGDELVVRLNPRCAEAVLVAAFPGVRRCG